MLKKNLDPFCRGIIMTNRNKHEELEKFKRDMDNISNLMRRYRWYVVGIVFFTVLFTIIELFLKGSH